ncbi:nitrogenase-stabilizing/protective protein NifW [Stutzerimonas azotifigens]|uniref:nitrogenase-stabilizing/protective protein NifW n=1 Tax=Stutzerimonas azotifigens TaxID=291995 RepID=UPI00040D6F0F|nr:nitrogenase-stabilizing/protective protein NifW [Stutzerimonas azotifigens]
MSEQAAEPNLDGALDEALEELVSAEDFLNFFGVPFVPSVVQVNRLHIMQRYHDYLSQAGDLDDLQEAARHAVYRRLLARAYEDFVSSDAQTEKVFKVFRMHEPQTTFVSVDQLLG